MIKKNILLFVILSVCASALNYLLYPLFSRILAPTEYINITTTLSLFTQVSAFLSSILAITIGLSKDKTNKDSHATIELLQAFLFKLFLVVAAIFLLLSPIIMGAIHTPILFAVPICLMMLLSIPIQIISGYLNGKNLMVKLGVVTVMAAGSQFALGVVTALVSQNGLATMFAMSAAQVITLTIVYTVFASDHLPGVTKALKTPLASIRKQRIGSLVVYTALASAAIMAISLIQILDLFIVQGLPGADIKFYTDMYVISRVVFFAGMIFIWPFLGEISLDHHHFNRKPFLKAVGYFAVISGAAIALMAFWGNAIVALLFGVQYDPQLIFSVGTLSVLYKFFMLIITAITLYFIVLRSYTAIWFTLATTALLFGYTRFMQTGASITDVLGWLTGIAFLLATIGTILLFKTPVQKTNK